MKDRFILHQLDSLKQAINDIEFRYNLNADKDQHLIESLKAENLELRQQINDMSQELNNLPQTIFDYYTDIVDMDDVEENIQELSKTYYEVMNYLTNID